MDQVEEDVNGDEEQMNGLRISEVLRRGTFIQRRQIQNAITREAMAQHARREDYDEVLRKVDALRKSEAIIGSLAKARRDVLEQLNGPNTPIYQRGASPKTPSSKGSPRPWPRSPRTPVEDIKATAQPKHCRPSLECFKSIRSRTASESPQRSRQRLRKQCARLSVGHNPIDSDLCGCERGRTRLRKGSPAPPIDHLPRKGSQTGSEDESLLRVRSPHLPISSPILQSGTQPMTIPSVCLPMGSHILQAGSTVPVAPSPLATEQKPSSPEASSPEEETSTDMEAAACNVGEKAREAEQDGAGTGAQSQRQRKRDGPGVKTIIMEGLRDVDGMYDADANSDSDTGYFGLRGVFVE